MHSAKLRRHIYTTTFRIAQTMLNLGRAHFDQRSRKAPIHYRRTERAEQDLHNGHKAVSLLDHSDWTARVLCLCQLCRRIQQADRTALLVLAYHAVTRPHIDGSILRDLPVFSLLFSHLCDRESVVFATTTYLSTVFYLCVCESGGVVRRKVFSIPRESLWMMELKSHIARERDRDDLTSSSSVQI